MSERAAAAPLILAEHLAKAFGPTQALRDCSFELVPGEVHAIIGENGSGKSTFVKILAGVHKPDAGTLALPDGQTGSPGSPAAALDARISPVFQEVLVVGPRSIVDNVWVGKDGLLRKRISDGEKRERAHALLEELLGVAPGLDRPVEQLSLSDRQAVAIVRALAREPKVLILDEATSALDVATRDRLFVIVRRLAGEGIGTIFISHRMDEIEEIADRITVMRSGNTVGTVARGAATMRDLVRMMTGGERLTGEASADVVRHELGDPVLVGKGVRLRPEAAPFDFEVRAGELVGLAGLEGMGQDAFIHALRGSHFGGGTITLLGDKPHVLKSPHAALGRGIAYVPRERRAEALFDSMSIRGNFTLPTIAEDATVGLVAPRRSERRLDTWVDRLGITLGASKDDIGTLSGGNQQKVVLARWLASNPRVLLLNDPTRGVDIGAKRDIYDLLVSLARGGIAIVMLSTEVDEHVELMDRVLVFREYELFAELQRSEVSREALVHAFFGRADA
ncbi:MAG TPA: sugar ABC transporter ATP-binding protein [Gaiellaceae bacterium]|nr:sugar ABC transporter ATP-binding protein [Gaiellaceae bacterium]